MLNNEQTLEEIKRAQEGDIEAKGRLVSENMPLIISIVKRYRGRGVEYDDLIQLGSLGILKAISGFDTSFDVKFSTYAVPMIMGEIKRYLRDDGSIKVSRALKTIAGKVTRFSAQYLEKNKTEPTVDEIAAELGLEREEIVFALESSKCVMSLYDKNDDDSLSLMEKITESDPKEMFDKIFVNEIIEKLPERERKIIYLRYFRDKTQTEISEELGVSQVQISRLENKIIEKLKKELTEKE